ncbi:siphovirus Gp157 family protein [Tepidamorphus sp. 3E244]|uniref:siphovirus Gp157 family protein n=1 Tax=Tepidamorphus sp. 3E244 TaxID=3385498 RepID=UPI0038FCD423
MHIKPSLAHYERLRELLIEAHPELDALTLENTLEGLTSLHEVLEAVVRQALDDEAICDALKGRISDAQDRLSRIQARARKKREAVRNAMLEADISSINAADFTASLRAGSKSLVVKDEAAIPGEFFDPQAPKLNRGRLSSELKRGGTVAGATLSNGEPSLSVRVR